MIAVKNKDILGQTGVMNSIIRLLETDYDAVPPLQNSVVGVIKHLTASNCTSLKLTASIILPQKLTE
jgi:hypothetical protein